MTSRWSRNVFAGNIVEGASLWGVLVAQGSSNVFYGNLIANSGGLGHDGYGLALGGVNFGVNNNLFYGNIFMNNSKNFGCNWEVLGVNAFDYGNSGNYWDDYFTRYPNARELGHSGIGDTPYLVYGNVNDNYPLTNMPKVPERTKPIIWSASFLTQPIPSQETSPTADNGTTTAGPSNSSDIQDNGTSTSSTDTNSSLNQTSEPFPWLPVAAVSVAVAVVVAVAAVVYLKKHRV